MRNLFLGVMLVVACLLTENQANAQWGRWHSSTANEGHWRGRGDYNRGTADVIRALGQSAIDQEIAIRMRIENKRDYVRMYWDRKIIRNEKWLEYQYSLDMRKQYNKTKNIEWFKNRKPTVLHVPGPHQLNKKTSTIFWHPILKSSEFDTHREYIQKLFRKKSNISQPVYQIIKGVDNMCALDILKRNVNKYRPIDYIEAKKMLIGLMNEARMRSKSVSQNCPFNKKDVCNEAKRIPCCSKCGCGCTDKSYCCCKK